MAPVNVGVIGCGTVGSGVARLLVYRAEIFAKRLGVPLHLKKVAEVDPGRIEKAGVDQSLFTYRDTDILDDPEIDIVVELIGGMETARDLVLAALERGKHVVTANKALIALHGNEIFAAAAKISLP